MLLSFEKNGFYLCKTDLTPILSKIRKKLISVFDEAAFNHSLKSISTDSDLIDLYHSKNRDVFISAYDQLRYLPEIMGLINDKTLLKIAKSAGLKFPVFCTRPILRADMPFDDKWAFPPHQDFVYNQGSLNSITIWIPFQEINSDIGPLKIIPNSHLNGLVPSKKGCIEKPNESDYKSIPMKFGEVLVFSQLLQHASGKNKSKKIRFSLQLRFNDLASKEWAERNYYINQKIIGKTSNANFKTYYPIGQIKN